MPIDGYVFIGSNLFNLIISIEDHLVIISDVLF